MQRGFEARGRELATNRPTLQQITGSKLNARVRRDVDRKRRLVEKIDHCVIG
jgi:hypothetical protein